MEANKKQAKIAVITRTNDRELLLRRALKSLQEQTSQDFVHVIINNGEKEKLEKLLQEYPVRERVVIHNEHNAGLIPSLNQGVRAVDSEYVTFLDDDDSWPAERLEKTVQYLDETGEKAVVVKMDIVIEEIVDGKINKISQELHPESGEGEISLFKQCYKNYLSNGIITYRRDVFDELGGYDETLETAEDWDFGIRLLLKYDVGFLRDEEPLFFYHQRPNLKGKQGNSVFDQVRTQERTINKIRNRYLRHDLNAGRLGVGYIMNALVHDLSLVVRLEGHINHVGREVESKMHEVKEDITSDFHHFKETSIVSLEPTSRKLLRRLKKGRP